MANYYLFSSPTGIEFEEELADCCVRHFTVKGDVSKKTFRTFSGTTHDTHDGVDVEIYGVGTDFTFNFSNKDHMEVLPVVIEGRTVDFKFGIRTGNSHKGFTKFETPVLVIGFDADASYVRNFMARITSDFSNMLEKIIETGQDAYWNWMDAHPEYA